MLLFWKTACAWQFPTGIALAIEKKSRRIEISLYCLARAIESFFACMADLGYLPPQSKNLKRADVVVFSISTAIIMHCYAIERDVFRSKYLNVLDWVFGVPLSATEATPRKSIYKTSQSISGWIEGPELSMLLLVSWSQLGGTHAVGMTKTSLGWFSVIHIGYEF